MENLKSNIFKKYQNPNTPIFLIIKNLKKSREDKSNEKSEYRLELK
jgi:hypothetical protein